MTPETMTAAAPARGKRKTRIGMVVSDKMDKTIVVAVERRVKHPLYKKYVRKTSKFHAHDERNGAKVGDKVRIIECRPLSKVKRWRLAAILERAK
jgi:small subunit ribosomal protein S17